MRAKRVIRCFHFQTRQETRALVQAAAQGHFVRPSGDAFERSEDRITSRASIRFRFSSTRQPPVASTENRNCLLTCMCASSVCVHILFLSIDLRSPLALNKCFRDRNHGLTFAPLLTLSRLTDFHSARLTCVTLPDLESRAFQADLLSQR